MTPHGSSNTLGGVDGVWAGGEDLGGGWEDNWDF